MAKAPKKPNKYKPHFLVRIPHVYAAPLAAMARKSTRSRTAEVVHAIREYLARHGAHVAD